MPNTLAHFGVQGLATRALIRDADVKWIFLGCVISDIPWILILVVNRVWPGIDPYDLRLYAIVLASLAASLLLSVALALVSKRPGIVFAVLALNSLLSLLLDALQRKWGNGVHLLAPFSWDLVNLGLFWPESVTSYVLTAFGFAAFLFLWRCSPGRSVDLSFRASRRVVLSAVLIGAYLAIPLCILTGPEKQDNHSVQTLRHQNSRLGKVVQFDREDYVVREGQEFLRTFAGEELAVVGTTLGHAGTVSVRATFIDDRTILVHELREHFGVWRDGASILGLALLLALWIAALRRSVQQTSTG